VLGINRPQAAYGLFIIGLAAFTVGLLTLFPLQNIGLMLMALAGLLEPPPLHVFRKSWLWLPVLYYAWAVITAIPPMDAELLKVKAALYVLFLAWPFVVMLNKERLLRILPLYLKGFALWVLLYAVAAAGLFFTDSESALAAMKQSKPFPLPFHTHHIYYGAMVAAAVLIFIWLGLQTRKKRWWGAALMLAVLFHVTVSRTGLAALYAALAVAAMAIAVLHRRMGWALGGVAVLALFIVGAYRASPPFQVKVDDFFHEIQLLREGANPNDRSLLIRWESWKAGWHVIHTTFPWGAGLDRLPAAVQQAYEGRTWLVPEQRLPPHAQWLYTTAALGMPGLILLLLITFRPLWVGWHRRRWLPMAWSVLMAVVFISEPFLERQTGIAFFFFFWTLWNIYLDDLTG